MVRKEILPARAFPRNVLLEKVNNHEKQNKIIFNMTCHPVFRDVRKIYDDGHKKVFPNVPIIGFKINKKSKGTLGKITITKFR